MCVYDTRQEEAWSGKSEARAVGRCTAEARSEAEAGVVGSSDSDLGGVGGGSGALLVPAECAICSALPGSDYSHPSFVSAKDRQAHHSFTRDLRQTPVFSSNFFYPLPLFCGLGPLGGNASGMESR
jgi:hypothetical protein